MLCIHLYRYVLILYPFFFSGKHFGFSVAQLEVGDQLQYENVAFTSLDYSCFDLQYQSENNDI